MGRARRIAISRGALVGLAGLGLILIGSFAAPIVTSANPLAINPALAARPPSVDHPFGLDQLGRDIFARVLYGGRLSLLVGAGSVAMALLIGIPVGLASGYLGGRTDLLVMRLVDVVMAFPSMLLALLVVAVLGPGLVDVLVAVGVASSPLFVRLTRASVLSVKHEEYVEAARVIGEGVPGVLVRHVLPNALPPLVIQATLRTGSAIITGASLSFLGLGVLPPTPEWGAMVAEGRTYITTAPYITIAPGVAIVLAILFLNLLGDGLNDLLSPRRSEGVASPKGTG